jgi:hypothetical protein
MAVAPDLTLVYHYTKASTALEFILQDRQLRLSPITESNDSNEAISHPVCVSGLPGERDQTAAASRRLKELVRKPHLIASFTRDAPDDQLARNLPAPMFGWQRDRMWAQYADNFRGVCLCFDRAALERNARTLDTVESARRVVFGNVTYDLEPPYPTPVSPRPAPS